jgi:hypothetical protein
MSQETHNPLQKYFRQPGAYVKLPSHRSSFFDSEAIEYAKESKEVAVYPMTATDEINFRTPDALVTGDAVLNTIKSCVPEVKDPKKLFKNDIDFLLAVIRCISYKSFDIEAKCPECKATNTYTISLDSILEAVEYLDNEYPVNLDNGLTIMVTPQKYESTLKYLSIALEESSFLRTLSGGTPDMMADPERMKKLSKSLQHISQMSHEIMIDSIAAVINEYDNVNVTDKNYIKEFVSNINTDEVKIISTEVDRVNAIGLLKDHNVKCTECEHEWKAEMMYDPVAFFTQS